MRHHGVCVPGLGTLVVVAACGQVFAWASVASAEPIGRKTAARPAGAAEPVPEASRGTGLFFADAAAETGLIHTYDTPLGVTTLSASSAAGGVVADFNNDGFDDLFVLGGGAQPDRMFVNNGDGTFTDRALQWGLARTHHAFGASAADFDSDGDVDLFITSYGPVSGAPQAGRFLLLRNMSLGPNSLFIDIAPASGVAQCLPGLLDGTGSGWGDYDLDGDLDLVVCSYKRTQPGNRLFRNDGADGLAWRFTDVTAQAGIERTQMQGFLPRFVDMNGDRYPELILVADSGSSRYFVNNGDGTFTDRLVDARGLEQMNGMGIDVGDVNQDGLLDMYVTNIDYGSGGNILLVQNPDHTFTNIAGSAGCEDGYWGWGTLMLDIDHDGDVDIAETNGSNGQFAGRPSLLFLNDGDGSRFTESGAALGFAHNGQGRGLVRIDLENDGDQDLVILCNNQPMSVFRNELIGADRVTPDNARWLRVLLDTSARAGLAPQGIGSMVRVRGAFGERIAPVDNGSNHCTTSAPLAQFGLGSLGGVDHLRVEWADGTHTTLSGVAADQILTVRAPFHPADFDGSGSIDAMDAAAFVDAFLAGDLNCDFTGDWRLDFFDVAGFVDWLRDGL